MSEFVTECPECGNPFNAIFQAKAGPSDPNPKPSEVTCIGKPQHTFPVLDVDRTADGRSRYRLGDQSDAG